MPDINWESVYREHMPRVYNYFRYRVASTQVAEDLTAATFEKAWRARDRYRGNLDGFSNWLFTIARNVACDHFRQHRNEVSLDDVEEPACDDSPESIVQRNSDFAHLVALIRTLPEREQDLVTLKYGAGLNNRKIAQITGLSESNVGTILSRVVGQLKSRWETER